MPVIVRDYSDDEATIMMVDSNIQRETILPSEKAKAYALKYEALKHQGKKSSYFVFHIRRSSNELLLSKIEKHINCFSECTST